MDRRIFFSLVLFSLLLLFLYLIFVILAPFFVPIAWAAVIGISTWPLYQRLLKRLKGRAMLSSSLMTLLAVLIVVLPFVGLGFLLEQEAARAYDSFASMKGQGKFDLVTNILRHPAVSPVTERLRPILERFGITLEGKLLPALDQVVSFLFGYTTALLKNMVGLFVKLVLMVVVLFFVYLDGDQMQRQFWSVIPIDEPTKQKLFATVKRVLSAVIYGVLLTCIVQGLSGAVGFWLVGFPSPVLFGMVMTVSALVPVVGTGLVWVPGALVLLVKGEVLKGIFLLAWGALLIGTVDNFIRPLFISGRGKIHILVTALGGLGGLAAFGLVGIVAGPILLALFLDFFAIYAIRVFHRPDSEAAPSEP